MYLGPILDGQCLRDYPPSVSYTIKEVSVEHETPKGNRRQHILGWHYQFTVSWKDSVITEAMYEKLRIIVNKATTLTFRPYPDKHYANTFTVKFVNGLDKVVPFKSLVIGYTGSFQLGTVDPVLTLTQWV